MGILQDRVAIVTGASSGVGRAAAVQFAREGADVVICARRLDRLAEVVAEIAPLGRKAVAVACDVSRADDITAVVERTIAEFGKVDILANIAHGWLEHPGYLAETTSEQALGSYVTGPLQSMLFMQACFPHMKARGYGRILNTASHSALNGTPGFTAYEMAKGAVMALTRNASQEWGQYGIVTNTFLPIVKTDPFEFSDQGRAAAERFVEACPLKFFGLPDRDCAPILAFMASEAAGYLNGQAIGIDGGKNLIA